MLKVTYVCKADPGIIKREVPDYDPVREARNAPPWANSFTYDCDEPRDSRGMVTEVRAIYYIDAQCYTLEQAQANNDTRNMTEMYQQEWAGIIYQRYGSGYRGYDPNVSRFVHSH